MAGERKLGLERGDFEQWGKTQTVDSYFRPDWN